MLEYVVKCNPGRAYGAFEIARTRVSIVKAALGYSDTCRGIHTILISHDSRLEPRSFIASGA